MSAGRNQGVAKQRLMQKVEEIGHLKNDIQSAIEDLANNAVHAAESLLQVTDRKEFRCKYNGTNDVMESCLLKLMHLLTSLKKDGEDGESSEDDSDDLVDVNQSELVNINQSQASLTVSEESESTLYKTMSDDDKSESPVSSQCYPAAAAAAAAAAAPHLKCASQLSEKSLPFIPRNREVNGLGSEIIGQVTYAESPAHFYIQPQDDEVQEILIEQLSAHYDSAYSAMLPSPALPGMLCCVLELKRNVWLRAIVVEVIDSSPKETSLGSVKVFYVDYGHSEELPLFRVKELCKQFHSIPYQAIPCCLYGIKPPNSQVAWNEAQLAAFQEVVTDCNVRATVRAVGKSLAVELVQLHPCSSDNSETNFSSRLLMAGIATQDYGQLLHASVCSNPRCPTATSPPSLFTNHNHNSTNHTYGNGTKDNDTKPNGVQQLSTTTSHTDVTATSLTAVDETSINGLAKDMAASVKLPTEPVKISFRVNAQSTVLPKSALVDSDEENNQIPDEDAVPGTTNGGEHKGETRIPKSHTEKEMNGDVNEEDSPKSCAKIEPRLKSTNSQDPSKLGRYDIPAMKINLKKFDSFQALMAAVSSPTAFYVHPVTDEVAKIDELCNDMSEAYANAEAPPLILSAQQIGVGSYWCCRFKKDDKWYRCQVLDVRETAAPLDVKSNGVKKTGNQRAILLNLPTIEVHVLYIDYGDTAWVSTDSLRLIYKKFCKLPALAVRCSLADISPKAEDDTWPSVVAEKLSLWGGSNTIKVQVMHHVEQAMPGDTLQVYLWSFNDAQGTLFNEELVKQGLVVSSVFTVDSSPVTSDDMDMEVGECGAENVVATQHSQAVSSNDQKNVHRAADEKTDSQCSSNAATTDGSTENPHNVVSELDDWDPMADDFQSLRNSYNVDVDDAGVALTGYKARDEKDICMFYQRGQLCPRRGACPYKHIKPPKDGITTDQKEIPYMSETVDLPSLDKSVALEVTAIEHPGKFFVNFPLTSKALDELTNEVILPEENIYDLVEEMQKEYASEINRHGDYLLRAAGEIVAAKYSVDDCWYRARVIECDPQRLTVRVFFVDYGNVEVVHEKNVRDIHPRFLHLPFQAVECSLAEIRPCNGDAEWNERSRLLFRRFTEARNLVANVVDKIGNKLYVHLYSTSELTDLNINNALVNTKVACHAPANSTRRSSSSLGSRHTPQIEPARNHLDLVPA